MDLLRRERVVLGAGLAATVVQQAALLALPWCVQHGLDEGITPGDTGRTAFWSVATCLVAAVMLAAATAGKWWSSLAANRIAAGLRADLAARVGTLDRAALAPFGRGDLAMRVTRDTELITAWVQGLSRWARVAVTVGIVVPAVGLLDPLLLVVLLVSMPLLGLLNAQFPGRYRAANERLSAAHGTRADAVEDLLSASAAVRGLGGEQVLVRRHDDASAHVTRHTLGVARISAWWVSAPPALLRLAVAVGLAVGGLAAIDGRITVGALVAFTSWMITMTVAVTVFVDLLVNRGQARVAMARIDEVLAARPAVAAPADPMPLPDTGMLAAVGVTAVRDGRTVVGPVDVLSAPGELVVVTGPTGSGKSVLVRLLCRLDVPDSGTIHFGGIDLRLAEPEQVWQRIGVVPQRPVVLSGTIRDNITLDREVDPELVREACRVAALDEFVDSLTDGYDTVVGERGETLSGGQIQRLALARGLLNKPPVLVLDDVTSAVDAHTEQTILRRLREWSPDTAIVFVSHRPAVVAAADRVIRLGALDREAVGG
ncbi:ABC transporter ATP-binding protein [Actinokineospora inagensis]|uniref:ABC transporter ATP-binding protein n=1 Tax=Actinokineospora inagensis TaxID=103730 RepID=UPI0003F4BECD|nr:ABC transporter ATP-binding protein [Actinokineospora inagensis]